VTGASLKVLLTHGQPNIPINLRRKFCIQTNSLTVMKILLQSFAVEWTASKLTSNEAEAVAIVSLRNFCFMNSELIGLVAGSCTTVAFLPQVIKTWKSRSAKDLSLGMFSFFCFGVLLWLIYGILVKDVPVITANAVTLVLASSLLFFKLRFKE